MAAFCTAFVLAESAPETAAYVGFAGAVAASRVHLRAHHPSDVVGGAAIGSLLGLTLRPVVNRVTPGSPAPPGPDGRPDGQGNGTGRLPVEEVMKPFAVTWDYRCPFARNVHEHLLAGLADGADWDVTFLPFTLSQGHVPEGGTPVWDDPAKFDDLVALAAGVVVRDQYPEQFGAVHHALFAARHDEGLDIRDPDVVAARPRRATASPATRCWPKSTAAARSTRSAGPRAGGQRVERLRRADVRRRRARRVRPADEPAPG